MKDIQRNSVEVEVKPEKNEMALKTALPPNFTDNAELDDFTSDDSFHFNLSDDEAKESLMDDDLPSNSKESDNKKSSETEEDILNKFVTLENGGEEIDPNQEDKLLGLDTNKCASSGTSDKTVDNNSSDKTVDENADEQQKISLKTDDISDNDVTENKKTTDKFEAKSNIEMSDGDVTDDKASTQTKDTEDNTGNVESSTKTDTDEWKTGGKIDLVEACTKTDEESESGAKIDVVETNTKTDEEIESDAKIDLVEASTKSDEESESGAIIDLVEASTKPDKKCESGAKIDEFEVSTKTDMVEANAGDDVKAEEATDNGNAVATHVEAESAKVDCTKEAIDEAVKLEISDADDAKTKDNQSDEISSENSEVTNMEEDNVQNDKNTRNDDIVLDDSIQNNMNTDYLQETVCNDDNSDNATDGHNVVNEEEKANILKDGMDTEDLLQITDVVKSVDEIDEKMDDNSNSCSSTDDKDDATGTAEETTCDKDIEEDENDVTENDVTENEIENDIIENEMTETDVTDNELTEKELAKECQEMIIDEEQLFQEDADSVVIKDSLSVPKDKANACNVNSEINTDLNSMDCDSDTKIDKNDILVVTESDNSEKMKEEESVDGENDVQMSSEADKVDNEIDLSVTDHTVNDSTINEDILSPKLNKRPHPASGHEEDSITKKIKLTESEGTTEIKETVPTTPQKIRHLTNLAEFMRSKKVFTLSREDLEEYCMQKICECLVYKSDLGEMQHKIKQYELMIEHWRKEFTRITKQSKDLEIVHKKLLHELKQKNEKDKVVLPVKITRSVGLQVKLDPLAAAPAKRKLVPAKVTENGPAAPTTQQVQNGIRRPVAPASRQTKVVAKTPILSQALQKDGTPLLATSTRVNGSPSPMKSAEKGVIDLTDEDEKKTTPKITPAISPKVPIPKITTPVKTNTPLTQNIRFVTSAIKTTNAQSTASGVLSTNAPRLMYLVQADAPQMSRGGVMLKIQSPNGVIGQNGVISSTPNSTSTVVVTQPVTTVPATRNGTVRLATPVTNTATRNVALKQTNPPTKHPAPLPSPPASQVSSRKPVLPKPHLSIRKSGQGIVLSWKMPYNLELYESIASYQLYAYQETNSLPSSEMWRKVGDIKALALPMACTLTQFADGNKYYFSVRAVDVLKRIGHFSDPEHIML